MAKFNFLVHLDNPTTKQVESLFSTFSAQTNSDWALHLIADQSDQQARFIGNNLSHPQVTLHLRPDTESFLQSANHILPTLPNDAWVSLLDVRATLAIGAIESLTHAATAKILYTDSVRRNRFGFLSLISNKGAVDPIRLRSQNYLDGLILIQKEWLQQLGGYDPRASDSPTHDILLKTIEAGAQQDITYLDLPLLQTYRDHRDYFARDSRPKPFMPRYDLWAIREHYKRLSIHAEISQLNGTVDTTLFHAHRWPVSVIAIAPLDQQDAIRAQLEAGTHKPAQLNFLEDARPDQLNQLIKRLDGPLVAILQGMPADCNWLAEMVDWAMLPNTGVVYGRTVHKTRLVFPGTIRAKYQDRDWNTRGDFNNLQVPRQISTAGAANMVTDIQHLLQYPFDESLLTLYGMVHGLQVHDSGKLNIYLPKPIVMADSVVEPSGVEVIEFNALYSDWQDQFGLYLSM